MKYNINEAKSIFTKQISSHSMHKVTYFCNGVSENLTIKMCGSMQFRSLNLASKLYIPSTIDGSVAIWADKKWDGFWSISLYIK